MLNRFLRRGGLVSLALLTAAGLNAGSVGPNCTNCFGSVYTLTNLGLQGVENGKEIYRFSYTVDATNFTGDPGMYVGSLSLKVSSNFSGITLVQAPGGVAAWSMSLNSQANGNGCSNGGGGWVCIKGGNAQSGSILTWIVDIKVNPTALLTSADIKLNWDPHNGMIVSEKVAMPEGFGVELPVVMTGLALFIGWRRRRRHLQAE